MPAGLAYFAWIDASETAFTSGHMRWDEDVFSFNLKQDEGDPASLTIVVRKPRNSSGDPIGLLGPGRKIWAWFALDCGPALIKFRGRLVGIPTSIFEELVTLEFVARPIDVVAQKEALAATLRVLPFYDEAVIDPARSTDPDVVLEGYTKVWHYDRETHVITVSDEISGEDGTVSFDGASDDGKVFYDGLGLTLSSGPLARVDVSAEFTWTQQARGTVDLTQDIVGAWPGNQNGIIVSYTLTASDWPKNGAALGDGWVVASATARDLVDWTVKTRSEANTIIVNWPDGSTLRSTVNTSQSGAGNVGYAPIGLGVILSDQWQVQYDYEPDDFGFYSRSVASFTRNTTGTIGVYCTQMVEATLVAGYTAQRHYTERVSFSLFADVQSILSDPEDGEALLINDVRSLNLSDGGQIGDPRRRSYITTARGNQSLEHLIALARAHLMKRARVVEITFAPKLARMPEITLRKNAFLVEPRVGEALGKIISYSIALDGSDGHMNCEVRIGCTIGRGGAAIATDGTPSYCTIDYVGHDYQQFAGRTVLAQFDDTSVGYQPPSFASNDDGINFLGSLQAGDVIEQPLVVTFGETENVDVADLPGHSSTITATSDGSDILAARQAAAKNILKAAEQHATFKLKSMNRSFETNYEIEVTDLQIPTGYDLETV